MNWLSGKPRRVISLHWPENDPIIERQSEFSYEPPGTWSVLDDQVLRSFIVRKPNELSSAVYLANLHNITGEETTTTFVKIATLPYIVHRVVLLPERVGFASLGFVIDTSSITLRIHSWDGTILKKRVAHAAAAYGNLVVNRHAVAVCTSSGQPSQEMYLAGTPDVYHRVDAFSDTIPPEHRNLTGDHILIWMISSDTLTSVRIPQDEGAPLNHQANFQFVGDSHIALGGKVACDTPSALLKAFHFGNPDNFSRTFTHGGNFEMDDDIDVIAKPGSSGSNAFLANYHHSGGRLTVVDNELLLGVIHSEPSSDDPDLHPFWDHPQHSRTIQGTLNENLPSISDNRLLVGVRIEPDEEGFEKFAIKETHARYGTVIFLYDFDQVRCKEKCNMTAAERISLESELRQENPDAQVSVVERNFYTSIEEEEDREWLPQTQPSQEWKEHLKELYEIGESRRSGTTEAPVLEFDEAPDVQKGNRRILFTRSTVWLPEDTDIRAIGFSKLALTTSGIVHVPSPGKVGYFFCFADS